MNAKNKKIITSIRKDLERPFYIGSVQNLYTVSDEPGCLISETTKGGSVFDVGTIFSIPGSDLARAGFRQLIYQQLNDPEAWKTLEDYLKDRKYSFNGKDQDLIFATLEVLKSEGAKTHHLGMIDRNTGEVHDRGFPDELSNLTLIKKYNIYKPLLQNSLDCHFYDYHHYHSKDNYVIPLEYITRFGVTSGSSILRKYQSQDEEGKAAYLQELGLNKPISMWEVFEKPIIDCTTKYEPEDRAVTKQEAALMTGIRGELFSGSLVLSMLASSLVNMIFRNMGLFLWDLKWEIATEGDNLVFVDTIDTDSVRATLDIVRGDRKYFVHFNKQAMRDYYKLFHPDWYQAVLDAKKISAAQGGVFTEILKQGQQEKTYPGTPEVDQAFMDIQEEKASFIIGFIKSGAGNHNFTEEAQAIAGKEIEYFLNCPNASYYRELNSVSV